MGNIALNYNHVNNNPVNNIYKTLARNLDIEIDLLSLDRDKINAKHDAEIEQAKKTSSAQQSHDIITKDHRVKELFESNPKLANEVYKTLGLNIIDESEITYTDEEGNPCAKMGLTNTVKGTDWKIVKDFKGKPKHSNGGVDITISDKGVTMRRGGKDIKAKYGLLIINN